MYGKLDEKAISGLPHRGRPYINIPNRDVRAVERVDRPERAVAQVQVGDLDVAAVRELDQVAPRHRLLALARVEPVPRVAAPAQIWLLGELGLAVARPPRLPGAIDSSPGVLCGRHDHLPQGTM